MKLTHLILLTSIISSASTYSQIPVNIDSVYNFIKRTSIHKNEVNWEELDKSFKDRLSSAKSDLDSIKSLAYIFERLNDFHSTITYNGRQFSNYPGFDDVTLKYLRPLVSLSNQRMGVFTSKILSHKYLYLQVPGIQAWGNNISFYAQKLSDSLCKYVSPDIKGIILDLRLNDGGQFTSMASGLAPLLGESYIGGGVNSDLKQVVRFSIKQSNLWMNKTRMTEITHSNKIDLSKLPVAVIIGPNTRSSGSILAISFKGRKKTIFIGDTTAAGYTTGNEFFYYANNFTLNLSTTYSIDGNNKAYKNAVPPDIIMKGEDNFDNIENDNKIKAALNWLKSSGR